MSSSTDKLKTRLATLNLSLEELEAQLDPLLAQTLPETVVNLDPVQQAKLHVLLPYLVHGLLFVYLKTQGIDPKTHPVVHELERVKQYFDKIKEAEDPAKRTTVIDKDAATRFIKHAISQAVAPQVSITPTGPTLGSSAQSSARVPVKVTDKMKARADYTKKLVEEDSEEEEGDDLKVIDEDNSAEDVEQPAVKSKSRSKGKQKAADPEDAAPIARRRKRPAVDVFTGNELSADSSGPGGGAAPASPIPEATTDRDKKKKRKKSRTSDAATSS